MASQIEKNAAIAEGPASMPVRMAFGVDSKRRELYSLRQARYDALGHDVDALAATAAKNDHRLSVLDIGGGAGATSTHLRARPNFKNIDISATDLDKQYNVDLSLYKSMYYGDLTEGYPEIASNSFDVVICEQVLEHLHHLEVAIATIERLVKPGGRAFVGVPIFLPPLHLARRHLVPVLDKLVGSTKHRTHVQAFSLATFKAVMLKHSDLQIVEARGFRMISGGILRPLENHKWWWQFNRWLGATFPAACIEVQIVLDKPAA